MTTIFYNNNNSNNNNNNNNNKIMKKKKILHNKMLKIIFRKDLQIKKNNREMIYLNYWCKREK